MCVIWIFFILIFVLFFPIGVWCEGYFTKAEKRIYWSLSLYGFLRIISGFLHFSGGKIWVLRKNCVKNVPIATILKENKMRYDVAKGFYLSKVSAVIEYGNSDSPAETLFILQAINSLLAPTLSVLRTKKNALLVSIQEVFLRTENKFSVSARAILWLTPLLLGLSIIKHFLNERLKYAKRKRKQAI